MEKLTCSYPHQSFSHDIDVKSELLQDSDYLIKILKPLASRFVILSDEIVASLHGVGLCEMLKKSGLEVFQISFIGGETQKTRKTKEELEDKLLEKGCGRDTCILALGGGIVSDLAGYVAATFCRGLPLVLIPTSLMAMVDTCIGGKSGVNVPQGKNMLGCIYQPKRVIIDPSTLHTLPDSEMKNGMSEIIKHALIADPDMFQFLENNGNPRQWDNETLVQVILNNCKIKKEIVEEDCCEMGKRSLLNFGHTVGHAWESLNQYTIPHGEAVAIGMLIESRISHLMGHLSQFSYQRIKKLLKPYIASLSISSAASFLKQMKMDKKSIQGIARFSILEEIGSCLAYGGAYCIPVDEKIVCQAIEEFNDDLHRH